MQKVLILVLVVLQIDIGLFVGMGHMKRERFVIVVRFLLVLSNVALLMAPQQELHVHYKMMHMNAVLVEVRLIVSYIQ